MSDFDKLSDSQLLELIVAGATIQRITGGMDQSDKDLRERIATLLANALANLKKTDELMLKLIEANDKLATERSSNKRRYAILMELAIVLWEDPSRYPKELGDLVVRIHKEVR